MTQEYEFSLKCDTDGKGDGQFVYPGDVAVAYRRWRLRCKLSNHRVKKFSGGIDTDEARAYFLDGDYC